MDQDRGFESCLTQHSHDMQMLMSIQKVTPSCGNVQPLLAIMFIVALTLLLLALKL